MEIKLSDFFNINSIYWVDEFRLGDNEIIDFLFKENFDTRNFKLKSSKLGKLKKNLKIWIQLIKQLAIVESTNTVCELSFKFFIKFEGNSEIKIFGKKESQIYAPFFCECLKMNLGL